MSSENTPTIEEIEVFLATPIEISAKALGVSLREVLALRAWWRSLLPQAPMDVDEIATALNMSDRRVRRYEYSGRVNMANKFKSRNLRYSDLARTQIDSEYPEYSVYEIGF